MTDEGNLGNPIDEAEALAAMANMAKMTKAFYEGLKEEGFSEQDSLRVTFAYIHGAAGGKLE